jgi:hypothetical protein
LFCLKENNKLRENPDNARIEEELVQVKMRDAEAQLAIKDLQKTIHVLNLEYQEFLNNRQAFMLSSSALTSSSSSSVNGGGNSNGANNNLVPGGDFTVKGMMMAGGGGGSNNLSQCQQLEEELLKVKLREAEAQSEMKSMSLKLMQLDTEVRIGGGTYYLWWNLVTRQIFNWLAPK